MSTLSLLVTPLNLRRSATEDMSLSRLIQLVPPPSIPSEVGTFEAWGQLESEIGVSLPPDYRDFVFAYGTGLFAGFYRIYNPFASSQYMSLSKSIARICDQNRVSQQFFPDRFPYPYFPEPCGLIPWGNDENGNDYFWLAEGPTETWNVVQDENRGIGISKQPFTMTGFLVSVLEGKTKPLAGDYPLEDDFVFEAWSPDT